MPKRLRSSTSGLVAGRTSPRSRPCSSYPRGSALRLEAMPATRRPPPSYWHRSPTHSSRTRTVANASDLNELPANALYVEGSVLGRVLMGTVGLAAVRSNRVLVVADAHPDSFFSDQLLNSVNAARSSFALTVRASSCSIHHSPSSPFTPPRAEPWATCTNSSGSSVRSTAIGASTMRSPLDADRRRPAHPSRLLRKSRRGRQPVGRCRGAPPLSTWRSRRMGPRLEPGRSVVDRSLDQRPGRCGRDRGRRA